MYIRTKEWMKNRRGIDARACIFKGPYCKYWKACIEEEAVEWFDSPKLRLLKKLEYDKDNSSPILNSQSTNRFKFLDFFFYLVP